MTSTRAKSPDKYIGIRNSNLQDRHLTIEEKCMLLNVYGVLRKEVPLSANGAAARAADLCGVGISALFSAKKEFADWEITIASGSLDPRGIESVEHEDKLDTPQPRDSGGCSIVRAKVLEMLGASGATTIDSVVEAIQNDPHLPRLEDSTIRQVIQQLNSTSYVSIVTPEQLSKWDTSTEGIPWEATSNATTSPPGTNVDAPYEPDFHMVKVEGGVHAETILPDPEFHSCPLPDVKTEEPASGETADVSLGCGIFPYGPAPSDSLGEDSGNIFVQVPPSQSLVNLDSCETVPYAGILVYGFNARSSSAGPACSAEESTPVRPKGGRKRGCKPPADSCNECRRVFGRKCPHLTNPCKFCPQTFAGYRTKQFVQHVMYMHTMRSLQCDFCRLSFPVAQQLVRHVVNTHMDSFLQQQGFVRAS